MVSNGTERGELENEGGLGRMPEAIKAEDIEGIVRELADSTKSGNGKLVARALEGILEIEAQNAKRLDAIDVNTDSIRRAQHSLEARVEKTGILDHEAADKAAAVFDEIKESAEKALSSAHEETKHLQWCYRRAIDELDETYRDSVARAFASYRDDAAELHETYRKEVDESARILKKRTGIVAAMILVFGFIGALGALIAAFWTIRVFPSLPAFLQSLPGWVFPVAIAAVVIILALAIVFWVLRPR